MFQLHKTRPFLGPGTDCLSRSPEKKEVGQKSQNFLQRDNLPTLKIGQNMNLCMVTNSKMSVVKKHKIRLI